MSSQVLDARADALIDDLNNHDDVLEARRGASSGTVKFTMDGHSALSATVMHTLANHDVTLGKGDNWIAVC